MALWMCRGCTAAYAVGAPRCPQCGSTDHDEEGQTMPKITTHGGPSIEGSEQSSPGISSSTSSEKDETSQPPSRPGAPSPARTTASRSKQARTAGSSAAGTDGGPTAPTSAPDHK